MYNDFVEAATAGAIALIEGNENKRFINYALDLPNLNFLSSKRFLKEMANKSKGGFFVGMAIASVIGGVISFVATKLVR